VRLGKLETVQRQEPENWSLRVWVGARSASLGSIDLSARAMRDTLVERALTMARLAPEDPYSGLAPVEIIRSVSSADEAVLQLYDPVEPTAAALEDAARAAEAAALAAAGVTNSSGARATANTTRNWHVTSEGLAIERHRSSFGLQVGVVAGKDGTMETDSYGRNAVWQADLPPAASIGAEAARRAVARLGPRRLSSTRAPVIFERRVATALISPLLGAIHGQNIARGTSFLRRRLGEAVFGREVALLADPLVVRGMGSHLVDSEGLPSKARALIDDGVLTGWILDVASARQLGMAPNSGSPGNLTLAPGADSMTDLMAQAGTGLLVTSMFGPSLNAATGDWSAGVSGIWFEHGVAAYPVNEITVAGSLSDFYARLIPASDLVIESGFDAPSLLVDAVTIAGA